MSVRRRKDRPTFPRPLSGRNTIEALEQRQLFALINAIADSFVRDGAFVSTNFGAAPLLYSKDASGDTREAYVKFDLSSAGTIGTAVLRFDAMMQTNTSLATRVGIFGLTSADWPEGNGTTSNASGDGTDTDNNPAGELTFNNRPAATSSEPIDIITITGGVQQSYALDVTNFARSESQAGHNLVGFVLRSLDEGNDFVAYVSREDPNFGPVLDVSNESGPSASLVAPNVTIPAGATTTVTVTYNDPEEVEILSLSNDDISVIGPDGQPLTVSNFSSNPTSSASSLAVTYTVQAPGGSWDIADAGTYVVRLNAGQVSDTFENFAPPGALGSFVASDNPPPTDDGIGPAASLGAVPSVTLGATDLQLTVTYTDDTAVRVSNIDVNDIVVSRNGTPLTIQSASPDVNQDGATRTVTYVVQAPGGSWDGADDGSYAIDLAGNQIADTSDHLTAAGSLGSFNVDIADGGGDGRTFKGNFGSTAPRGGSLTFLDADGTTVTLTLKGGSGQAFERAGEIDLDLAGTSTGSVLSIRTRAGGDGRVRLGNVTGIALKSLTGKTADLVGGISLTGTLSNLQLGNVDGASLTCAAGGLLAVKLDSVFNFSIDSGSIIKSLKVGSWSDDEVIADVIAAPSIGSITCSGSFAADVRTGSLKSLKATSLDSAIVRATDSIGKVTLMSISNASILAGVKPEVTDLPDALDDFSNPAASLAAVSVKSLFSDAIIAAPSIGKASLGTIQPNNGAVALGVTADNLKSLSGTASGQRIKLSKAADPSKSITIGDFAVRVL